MDITGTVLSGASPLVFEGATADAHETTWAFVDPTGDRVISIPNATDTLIGKATTDTLTNKTFDLGGTGNSLTGSLAEFNSALQGDSFATLADTLILTNKTFTSPTITSGVFNTGLSGSAFKDEDNMSSDSATSVASQQSIKAYIDGALTGDDLDGTTDSGNFVVDLDSQTLAIAGGTQITTAASSQTLTVTIGSGISITNRSETLTNKTFNSSTIDTLTLASGYSTSSLNLQIGGTGIFFEGSSDDANETLLDVEFPTQDNVITIPDTTMTMLTTATHASQASHLVRVIALS
jgi:hypothetical protein